MHGKFFFVIVTTISILFLLVDSNPIFKREDDGDDNGGIEFGSKLNSGGAYGDGIFISGSNGDRINICEQYYVDLVAQFHPKLKDVMISACSGSSG